MQEQSGQCFRVAADNKGKGTHSLASKNLYDEIAETILSDLEQGVVPWSPPWTSQGGPVGIPVNATTGRTYSGGNIFLLWAAMKRLGFARPAFITFRQCKEAGSTVLKGERGVGLVYWNPEGARTTEQDGKERLVPVLRRFTVFNVQQTTLEGTEAVTANVTELSCAKLLSAHGVDVRVGADRAYYDPSGDFVRMPPKQRFESEQAYEAVLLHELVHWTADKARCDRPEARDREKESYAREELVAEMGSAFLCARLGMKYEVRHSAYIESWLKMFRGDRREFFRAASAAQKAVEFLEQPLLEQTRIAAREGLAMDAASL